MTTLLGTLEDSYLKTNFILLRDIIVYLFYYLIIKTIAFPWHITAKQQIVTLGQRKLCGLPRFLS